MSKLTKFHGPQGYLHLAQSPAATSEQLRELAGSPHSFVRRAVASNPSAPPDVLDTLLPSSIESYDDAQISMAIVRNPATDRRTRARGPLLRHFLEELVTASGEDLLAFIDDAAATDAEKDALSLGTAELVVDTSAGTVSLTDTMEESHRTKIALEVFRSWVSNVAAVTPRLRYRIWADFGDGPFNEVLWALGWLPALNSPPNERLPAAAILFAGGDWHRLMDFVLEASIDFRDALILGGLQHTDWPKRLDVELA